jgi:hypothetical protein
MKIDRRIFLSGLAAALVASLTRDFYTLFYHVTPTAAQIERVLGGRD